MALKKNLWLNILFLLVGASIIGFLLSAPEKSTSRLPLDGDHQKFYAMGKKEAEKYCLECHGDDKQVPLRKDHPAKLRCLFCHTKIEE